MKWFYDIVIATKPKPGDDACFIRHCGKEDHRCITVTFDFRADGIPVFIWQCYIKNNRINRFCLQFPLSILSVFYLIYTIAFFFQQYGQIFWNIRINICNQNRRHTCLSVIRTIFCFFHGQLYRIGNSDQLHPCRTQHTLGSDVCINTIIFIRLILNT